MSIAQSASINEEEVEKFSRIADQWWDENGKFKPLHKFNPVRIAYIKEQICKNFNLDINQDKPLSGINILDVGCGGGLLSAPISRLGAKVTAIDASEKNIQVARVYAEKNNLDIDFKCQSVESLAEAEEKFDVVLNMEVIEHVADVASFMTACTSLVKKDGLMIVATINRTAKSYALAIVGAEYILQWMPRGTHDWKKFFKPHEIEAHLQKGNLDIQEIVGASYNIFNDKWQLSDDISVNYMINAKK